MFIMLLGWLWFRFAFPKVWGYGNMKSFPDVAYPRHPPKSEWVLGIRYQRTEVACPYPMALSLASPFTL